MSNAPLRVATGLAKGQQASPTLAAQAVQMAMQKADISQPCSVLLYLTTEFATNPQPAIKAAASIASTTQIMGCSASGIFTEDEWVLDGAAAAAMVFSHDVLTHHASNRLESEYLLTLAAPSALNATWLDSGKPRFGGVSGDATGRGPFSVWHDGKGVTQGYCELAIQHGRIAVGASHGLKQLASPRKVTASLGFDLVSIANVDALNSLMSACQAAEIPHDNIPYHLLMVAYASSAKALNAGEYRLASIVMSNEDHHTITLSQTIPTGSWICWTMRDTQAAQQDIRHTAQTLSTALGQAPDFGLLFSCLGRGPYFYDGDDLDLTTLKAQFPRMPIIGFYGNGEIAPMMGGNTLLAYSAVLGLFSSTALSNA